MSTKLSKQKNMPDLVHPRSRKANQLHRTQLRQSKLSVQKNSRKVTQIFPLCIPISINFADVLWIVDRVTWFQLIIDPEAKTISRDEVHSLITEHLGRFDEEIAKLQLLQRAGRPKPKRLGELEMVRQQEKEEYERTGFQLPDLMCTANLSALKAWDGTRESFSRVKLIRVKALVK